MFQVRKLCVCGLVSLYLSISTRLQWDTSQKDVRPTSDCATTVASLVTNLMLARSPALSLPSSATPAGESAIFRQSVPACGYKVPIRNAMCVVALRPYDRRTALTELFGDNRTVGVSDI